MIEALNALGLWLLPVGFGVGALVCGLALWLVIKSKTSLLVATIEGDAKVAKATYEAQKTASQETLVLVEKRVAELEKEASMHEKRIAQITNELAESKAAHASAQSVIKARDEQIARNQEAIADLKVEKDGLQQTQESLREKLAAKETELEKEQKQNAEKLELLEEAKEALSNQFKALASDILDEKTKKFTEQNKEGLSSILKPLETNLGSFKETVEKLYVQEGKDRSALQEQVRQLMQLNQQLSEDATSLTRALKGQVKTQGSWGEYLLEQLLENAGLIKEEHYDVQKSFTLKKGNRVQPDAILYLPEKKHLIVDSKVSLVAYDEHVNAESESERTGAARRLVTSIRNHINDLSSKNYQSITELKTQDYVIMFVSLEPAYILAMSLAKDLWQEAWKKNVLLVSPSIFLFVVRTVAHSWMQEQQKQNVQAIAQRGEALYNKFVGFVSDLQAVGKSMEKAKEAYDGAMNKLHEGKGHLIGQAEKLRKLGLKPKKRLPSELLEMAGEEDDFEQGEQLALGELADQVDANEDG